MRFVATLVVTFVLASTSAFAQFSAGVYGGVTTPTPSQSTFMVMADYGTRVDVEPWVQSYGSSVQVGADAIVISSTAKVGVGGVFGVFNNEKGYRYGVAGNVFGAQVRLMRTNEGVWQGIGYYNFYLTKRTYVQVWLAPAQGSSAYLVGVGHVFKE